MHKISYYCENLNFSESFESNFTVNMLKFGSSEESIRYAVKVEVLKIFTYSTLSAKIQPSWLYPYKMLFFFIFDLSLNRVLVYSPPYKRKQE